MSKEMTLAGGIKYLLTDEEATVVMNEMISGAKKAIGIKRLGMVVNAAGIMAVADPESVPYFMGNPMNADMTKVFVQGEWKKFAGKKADIEYRMKSDTSVVIKKDALEISNADC